MRWLDELRGHPDRSYKYACISSCFLTLGMSMGIGGLTLLDLKHQVNASLASTSFTFSSSAIGYGLGSLCSE